MMPKPWRTWPSRSQQGVKKLLGEDSILDLDSGVISGVLVQGGASS